MRTTAGVAALLAGLAGAVGACGLNAAGRGRSGTDGGTIADATIDSTMGFDVASGGDVTDEAAPADASQEDAGPDDAVTEDAAPMDVVSEPVPTCTGCTGMMCCNAGTCANPGDHTCGDPGQAFVDCTTAPTGTKCEMIMGHQVCGCDGPGSQNQCPPNMACHTMQCGTACDGQHPCNGGCCSGNDLATSTCMTSCEGGTNCMMNYCQ